MENKPIKIIKFENHKFQVFGTIQDPLFVAAELCNALEIQNPSQAVARLPKEYRGICTIYTPSGAQEMLTVTEFGFWELVMTSRSPKARPLKEHVYKMLKEWRLTGGVGQKTISKAQMLLKQAQIAVEHEERLNIHQEAISEHDTRLLSLEGTIKQDFLPVKGFANIHKIKVNRKQAAAKGIQARKYCKQHNLPYHKVSDALFGQVNAYPIEALNHAFGLVDA